MDRKYWVPALERADSVLRAIAAAPSRLKLIDLSKRLDINKSSMFSLLHTLEQIEWVVREKGDTYVLGPALGIIGHAYFQQFDLTDMFYKIAAASRDLIGETIQMGRLVRTDVLYLGKLEAVSTAQISSEPGMKYPAHCTGLGKMLLSTLPQGEVDLLYGETDSLVQLTPYTIGSAAELNRQLQQIRQDGFAYDLQESVLGFCCVAAAVYDVYGKAAAAVSFSMPLHRWEDKHGQATLEITRLAERLSLQKDQRNDME